MEGSGPRQTGRAESQWQDNFLNLERGKDQDNQREGSVNTSHTSKSRSKGKDHVSHKQNEQKALQQEINDLKKKLRRAQRKRPSPGSDTSSDKDGEYRRRSKTPPSETFSYEEERPRKRGHKNPSYQGLANDAMSKALDCISQSPFTRRIERAALPRRFNQSKFAIYNGRTDPVEHEPGHTTDDCRNLKNHLDQLVREGKLRHLLHRPEQSNVETRQGTLRPPIGTINVILTAPGRTGSSPFRVMSVDRFPTEPDERESKRAKVSATPLIRFTEEDKQGTLQPHDDALVVTLKIGGYDVKRVLVDQGSAMEVMYPDLYKGLNLKPEDLSPYNSPLVSFEGKIVIPKGMIRLPVQTNSDVVEVNFIVVDAYSPYTAIVARPWLHALGAVSSTLHQKVKYPSGGQVKEIIGNQGMARQCMVSAISQRPNREPSTSAESGL
ncbi:uncharacterized protein LOC115952008 [Quercus lobata]|uniref:uncharacterized protein LOC115952008 n=1 Tax=Quercus lobata TaxID=97700 RepID=UPI0012472C46|nr:uncharacterized protein LOC115952008 [Quercus lobata]